MAETEGAGPPGEWLSQVTAVYSALFGVQYI